MLGGSRVGWKHSYKEEHSQVTKQSGKIPRFCITQPTWLTKANAPLVQALPDRDCIVCFGPPLLLQVLLLATRSESEIDASLSLLFSFSSEIYWSLGMIELHRAPSLLCYFLPTG